jgi:hypothetical protein
MNPSFRMHSAASMSGHQPCLRSFAGFRAFVQRGRARKIARNTRCYERDDGGIGVIYHDTEVLVHYPGALVVITGGWWTVSTLQRVRTFSRAHLYVSRKGVFRGSGVVAVDGVERLFHDGIVISTPHPPMPNIYPTQREVYE